MSEPPAFDLSLLERMTSFEPDPEEMAAVDLDEINPYGPSDPCLFGDHDAVERGGKVLG